MSQTSTSSATSTGAAALPRVNLLPPEIHQQAFARRIGAAMVGVVVLALLVTGAFFLQARNEVNSARKDLRKQNERFSQLTATKASLDSVGSMRAQVDAASATLYLAMGQQLAWSKLLKSLVAATPKGVAYSQVSVSFTIAGTVQGGGAPPAPGVVGTLSLQGSCAKHADVAALMRATSTVPGLVNPYFTDSTEQVLPGTTAVGVTFQATNDIQAVDSLIGPYPSGSIDQVASATKASAVQPTRAAGTPVRD